MKSVFMQKETEPSDKDLKDALGDTFEIWQELVKLCVKLHPKALPKWHFSGDKYGWSFRISDQKRVLIYLLPRDKFFKVAFVFGQKATDEILRSNVSEKIVKEISNAKLYAEGRGIRIDVNNRAVIGDIKELINIKIRN
jgi:hypothetical protein